jgi:pimeloyl-ACP methyl ester carboxylesterase
MAHALKTTLTFTALLLLPTAANAGPRYLVSLSNETLDGYSVQTAVVQEGFDPRDRFTMHRVRKLGEPTRAVFLALPPLAATFATYTFEETGDLSQSFAGLLAAEGIEVWGYSPREANLVAGQCETMAVDCSIIGEWGLESAVDDALFITDVIKVTRPWKKIVAGGLSYGSAMAVAMANRRPNAFGGLALWDVATWSDDEDVIMTNEGFCDALDAQLAADGVYDISTQQQKGLAFLAQSDPMLHQLLVSLLDAPPLSPVTHAVPNFSLIRGDALANEFLYGSDERVIGNILGTFMDYTSVRKARDLNCSLAGEEEFVDELGAYHKPVLLLGGGRGFGPWMGAQVDLMGTSPSDVEVHIIEDYGHVDTYMSPDHADLVESVVIDWVTDQVL